MEFKLIHYDVYKEEFCKITEHDIKYNKVVKNEDKITVAKKKTKLNCVRKEIDKYKIYKSENNTICYKKDGNRKVLLWIDGLNASFIHYHVTRKLNIDVIALDLKRCGRSKKGDDVPHYTSDFRKYIKYIDYVVDNFCGHYDEIILYGHSTGGLIVTLYGAYLNMSKRSNIKIILNAPLFKINKPWYILFILKYIIYYIGRLACFLDKLFGTRFGLIKLDRGNDINWYVMMKHKLYYVNGFLSSIYNLPVRLGFVTNVIKYHNLLHKGKLKIECPVLIIHSNRSGLGGEGNKCMCVSDNILNIDHIKKYSKIIEHSNNVKIVEIVDGCHDVLLSNENVVDNVVDVIKGFIISSHN